MGGAVEYAEMGEGVRERDEEERGFMIGVEREMLDTRYVYVRSENGVDSANKLCARGSPR
ncbi:hypothetical protein M422DRAFT_36349 [Sphaerobolus stellatus SS14]|uniref:Uncharacterized protein n=1 Tax=Sphaerobolus stellatus (strain SS14) TaxID=990650 RepID=A0A0C9UPZ2_SPHS4|nr:hypothetical protein M422DRAFT_36349 [Sphaerobolus stellatus SS14]